MWIPHWITRVVERTDDQDTTRRSSYETAAFSDTGEDPELYNNDIRVPSTPTRYTLMSAADTEDFGESTTFSPAYCCIRMCWNLCVPCYSGCVCTWHVLRSVPRWTLFSSTFVIVGWIFSTTFLNESEEVLEEVNLQIVRNKYVHFSVNSIGVALICVDLVIAVTSSLLTGWTKEAFCLSLRTGSFEYKNGSAFQCGTCANILRISGWAILLFVALFAFLATVLATLGALVSFTYMVIASCGLGACQGGEEEDLPSFVTVMKANKFNVLSGNIDYETYCSNDHDKVSLFQIKLDVSLTWCF